LPRLTGPLQPWPAPLRLAQAWLRCRARLLQHLGTRWLLAALLLFCAAGIWQLSFKDDVRQWISRAPHLMEEAQRVSAITGVQPTSQFFLVRAADQEQLLQRLNPLGERLDALVQQQQLGGYQSLSQLLAPPSEQLRLRQAIAQLPALAEPLLALGVTPAALATEAAQ